MFTKLIPGFLFSVFPLLSSAQLVIGVSSDVTVSAPAESWADTAMGDSTVCSSTDTSGSWTIDARGSSDEGIDGCFVHQEVDSGDVEVIMQVDSFSGTVENFTFCGPMVAEDASASSVYAANLWPNVTQARGKYRQTTSGNVIAGIFGDSSATLSQCLALTYDLSEQTTTMFESSDASCSGSWTEIFQTAEIIMTPPYEAGMFATSHNVSATATCNADTVTLSDTITISGTSPAPDSRVVDFVSDFESGMVQDKRANPDGWAFITTDSGQSTTEYLNSQDGDDVGPDCSTCDGRIVDTGDITPEGGSYALRMRINLDRDYTDVNSGKDKPRNNLRRFNTKMPYDEIIWHGFAIQLPSDYECDGGSGDATQEILWQLHGSTGKGAITLELEGDGGGNCDWVVVEVYDDASPNWDSATGTTNNRVTEDTADDIGEWTCWVFRYRLNPYTGAGPHTGDDGESYVGDRGILEVWKESGSGGGRAMTQVYSRTSQPVGFVPADHPHRLYNEFNLYKGGWRDGGSTKTDPVTIYYDSIFWGEDGNGTDYDDVHCEQEAEPS